MATMQVKKSDGQWVDIGEFSCFGMASGTIEYRVKPMPEKKPDVEKSFTIESHPFGGIRFVETTITEKGVLRCTFSGETHELINAEVLK